MTAKYLGTTVAKLYRLRRAKKITCTRIDYRNYASRKQDLDVYLARSGIIADRFLISLADSMLIDMAIAAEPCDFKSLLVVKVMRLNLHPPTAF